MEFRKMVNMTLYARHKRVSTGFLNSVGEGEGGI